MNTLFCTDGSKISYNAIKNFNKWIPNTVVDIFSAADWSFLPDSLSIEDSEFVAKCTNTADTILNYTETLLLEHEIKINEKIKMCGATVDCIMETCEKKDYNFIVLGSNGKKGIQKWLGSVSQEVAATAKVSTYIAKEKRTSNKILFTVEGNEISRNVITEALKYLDLKDKEIHLVTVFERPDYLFLEGNIDSNWISEVDKKQETTALILLKEFEKQFGDNGFKVTQKGILAGNPANEIIKYTDKENIDLVVCGVRNRKYLSKFLLTSVSKRVLENTKSDMLIIRPNNFER